MVKSLILCEGESDKEFLEKFCRYLNIENKIDVQYLGNKSNFFKQESYSDIKQQIKMGQYKKVLFIVDSDFTEDDKKYGGFENSKNKLQNIINQLGFTDIASYYIMCDPENQTGNLEHLILSTLDDKQQKCVKSFLDCLPNKIVKKNKKIVLRSYYSIFEDNNNNNNNQYSFNHENFRPLKDKISSII